MKGKERKGKDKKRRLKITSDDIGHRLWEYLSFENYGGWKFKLALSLYQSTHSFALPPLASPQH